MNQNGIRARTADRGFALLFVLFLVALVIIGASVAVLNFKTEGLREKETVMIWRGEQYQRAIGLYYRKFGHFPTSIDQLVKGTNGIRFLREEYKDPMNHADGSWRLIYVTPAGQLIGSVRYVTLQQMALADRARIMGIAMGQSTGASDIFGGASSTSPGPGQQPAGAASGAPSAGSGATATPPGTQSPGQSANGQPPNPQQVGGQQTGAPTTPAPPQPAPFGVPLQSQSLGGMFQNNESATQVSGGFIVGVASKMDRPSLKIYKGGTTYKQWEFIYNPLEQVQTIGVGIGLGTGGSPTTGNASGMPVPHPPQPQIPH